MNKRPGDTNIYQGKTVSKQMPIMDLYFEEEDSSEIQDREKFSEILSHDDVKYDSYTDITEKHIDSDVTPEEAEEINKDEIPKKKPKAPPPNLDDLNIPEDVIQMINDNQFYPFGCMGMKKNYITINRLLYLLQRMNTISMEQCTATTNSDSRRIYDIMNVLSELGLVEKISGNAKGVFHYKKERRKKVACGFQFCSKITTDDPIDFKELRKYMD